MRSMFRQVLVVSSIATGMLWTACVGESKHEGNDNRTAKVQRGDYLVNAVANCMHCHADRDFTKFSGPTVPGTEGKGGQKKGVSVPNITPTVLGSWTDDDIKRAITTGSRTWATRFFSPRLT